MGEEMERSSGFRVSSGKRKSRGKGMEVKLLLSAQYMHVQLWGHAV